MSSALIILKRFYAFFSSPEGSELYEVTHPAVEILYSLLSCFGSALRASFRHPLQNELRAIAIAILRDVPLHSFARYHFFQFMHSLSLDNLDLEAMQSVFDIAHRHMTITLEPGAYDREIYCKALAIVCDTFRRSNYICWHAANRKDFMDALLWCFSSAADTVFLDYAAEVYHAYLACHVVLCFLEEPEAEPGHDFSHTPSTRSPHQALLGHEKFPDVLSVISREMLREEGSIVLGITSILPPLCSGPSENIELLYRHGMFDIILKLSNTSNSESGPEMARDALRAALKVSSPEVLFRVACRPHFWKAFMYCVRYDWGEPPFLEVIKKLLEYGQQIDRISHSSSSEFDPPNSWRDMLLQEFPYDEELDEDSEDYEYDQLLLILDASLRSRCP